MPTQTIKNENLRSPVTVIEEMPDLDKLGKAGMRLKLDTLLMLHHGPSEEDLNKLTGEDIAMLRQMAREPDAMRGIDHQIRALGVLGALQDRGALLQIGDLARNAKSDMRLRIAATSALGEIGDPQAVDVLRTLVTDKVAEVKMQAIKAIANVGTSADVAVLERLTQTDKSFVGELAGKAAGNLRTRLNLADM